jgi:hypothetical protein
MTGIFANPQPKYAALGIATFPFDATEEIKRGPLVSHYNRMGLRASKQMAIRSPDAPGLAATSSPSSTSTSVVRPASVYWPTCSANSATPRSWSGRARVGFMPTTGIMAKAKRFGRTRASQSISLVAALSCCRRRAAFAPITRSFTAKSTIWRRSILSAPSQPSLPIPILICARLEKAGETRSSGRASRAKRIW